jgi:hypothetical protein
MSAPLEKELLSRWQEWFNESPPATLELLAVGRRYRNSYTLLPFPNGGQEPVCVVKVAAGEEQASKLRREFGNLTLLRTRLTDQALLDSFPSPLALVHRAGLVVAIHSYVSGRSLPSALSYPRQREVIPRVLDSVAEWLVAFQAATKAEAPAPDNGHDDLADALASADEIELLRHMEGNGLATPQKMSGVWGLQHGDLKPEHVLWRGRSIGVVDWDEMRSGSVTSDWFYFLALSALQIGGVESNRQLGQAAPTLEAIFFSRHWFGELAMQATHRFLDRLSLPRSMAAPLFVLSICRDGRYLWPYLAQGASGAYRDVVRLFRHRWGDLVFNRAAA